MKKKISLILAGLIVMPLNIKAYAGNMNIEGTTLNVGETKTITVSVSDNVAAADGNVTSLDSSCVEIINVTSPYGSGNYFMNIDLNGNPISKAATITIKGLKQCNTNIKVSNASIASSDGLSEDRNLTFVSNTINVLETKQEEPKVEIEQPKEEIKVEEQQVVNNSQVVKIEEKKATKTIAKNNKTINKIKKLTIKSKKISKIFKFKTNKLFKLI